VSSSTRVALPPAPRRRSRTDPRTRRKPQTIRILRVGSVGYPLPIPPPSEGAMRPACRASFTGQVSARSRAHCPRSRGEKRLIDAHAMAPRQAA